MEVSGEYLFEAPQELVWEALQDPAVLSAVMPGGEDFQQIGDNEYGGLLNIKVGPVQGKFKGTIRLSDIVAPESYHMEVDGNGAPGFVKADGGLKLSGQGSQTLMTYIGTAQVGGRIASVGQRLLETSAKSIIRQSLEGLNEYVKVQAASQAAVEAGAPAGEVAKAMSGAESPQYRPPSQTAVAMNVAKDVASDIVPPRYRLALIALLALVVVLILYLLLT